MKRETFVKRACVHADGIRSPPHDRLRADRERDLALLSLVPDG